jgi:HK97 gp10 family phage protein
MSNIPNTGSKIIVTSFEGLKELDNALSELNRATARNVAHRALRKGGKIIAENASLLAPDDPETQEPDLHRSIIVSTKIEDRRGKNEFHKEMLKSGDRSKARAALIKSRIGKSGGGNPIVMMFVGVASVAAKFSRGEVSRNPSRYAHLVEFGTFRSRAQPFMTPAWENNKMKVLSIISKTLKTEVAKAVARAASKALKK